MLSTFLSQIVNGLVFGSLIGLIALGYTMVYGIIELINFAHGEIFMSGSFVAWAVITKFLQLNGTVRDPLVLAGVGRQCHVPSGSSQQRAVLQRLA